MMLIALWACRDAAFARQRPPVPKPPYRILYTCLTHQLPAAAKYNLPPTAQVSVRLIATPTLEQFSISLHRIRTRRSIWRFLCQVEAARVMCSREVDAMSLLRCGVVTQCSGHASR